MGNLVPGLLSFPFAVGGYLLWNPDSPLEWMPIAVLALFPVIGWISLSAFGLWSNAAMRDELGKRYGRERGRPEDPLIFVGFATPQYRSVLDPHEDIGFLVLHPEALEIYGDQRTEHRKREEITGIRLAKNTHSWVGLGGWVVVESPSGNLLIESREKDSLAANRKNRVRLLESLRNWAQIENPRKNP